MAVVYRNFYGAVMPLSGASTTSLYGSAGAEALSGSAGNDLIVGGGLGHAMSGGLGDDNYTVSAAGDSVVELSGEGVDTLTLKTLKGFVLPDNVENMVLAAKATGYGNNLGNLMIGNIYSQTLVGGGGDDVLVGSKGADTFVFAPGSGHDVVWDFSATEGDQLRVQGYGFTSFSQILGAMTQSGSDVILTLSPTDQVKLLNTNVSHFHAADVQLETDTSAMHLSFADEFDALSLHNSTTGAGVWDTTFPFGQPDGDRAYTSRTLRNNNEKQIYVDAAFKGSTDHALGINPFSIHDGVLDITGQRTDQRSSLWYYKYTSGLLTTHSTFAQQYGYFEVSAKLPSGNGMWPAFWLLPTDGAKGVELDVLEQVGHEMVYFTSHSSLDDKTRRTDATFVPDYSTAFHKYGMLWTSTKVSWLIDGVEQASIATPADMHSPMYMLLNMAVGGNWPGDPDPSFQSASYSVDYVRAYSLDMANGEDGDLSVNLAARVGSSDRAATAFRVTGVDAGATAQLTFVDGAGHTATADVTGNGDGVADLSALQEGSVTVSIVETKAGNIATGHGDTFVLDSSIDSDLAVTLGLKVGAAARTAAPFTVTGLNPGSTGTVTFTDALGAHVAVTVSDNGAGVADLTGLADGLITAAISATNGVGVVGNGAGATTLLDTTADSLGDLTVILPDTTIVGVEAAHVNFNITGLDKDASASIVFTDHLGATVTATAVPKVGGSFVDLSSLADGAVTVTITATDSADNVSVGAGANLTLDIAPNPGAGLGVTAGPSLIGGAGRASVAYAVAGLASGSTGVVTFDDGLGHTVTANVPSNGLRTADLTSLHDGVISVSIVADDGLGNVSTGDGGSVTLDTTADVNNDLAMNFDQPTGVFDIAHFAYTVSGLDSDATALVTFTDSVGDSVTVNVAANGNGLIDLSGLAPGSVTVTILATDAAGNSSPDDPALNAVTVAIEQGDIRPIVGDHFFRGTSQNDIITGTSGNDIIIGGQGNDQMDGAGGIDTVSYADATSGVTIVIRNDGVKQDTKGSGQDILLNIENVVGSSYDDTLSGDVGNNTLVGGAGNDVLRGKAGDDILVGGAGDDQMTGGDGSDTAWYGNATSAITIDLSLVTAQDTHGAGIDTLLTMENVVATDFADSITGNKSDNRIEGGAGDDVLMGAGGADTLLGGEGDDLLDGGTGDDLLDGGAGVNTVSYGDATGGIKLNLSLSGPQNTGRAGYDTLVSIQNVSGSNFADTIVGNDGNNVLSGGDGADVLSGGLGNDNLYGGTGNDTLDGGPGDDSLDGGDGFDTVTYASATAGVTLDLSLSGPQATGGGGTDSVTQIERIVGSAFADHLTSGLSGGTLEGGLGDDVLIGLAGPDILLGGDGADVLNGGAGDDVLNGGTGVDTASYAGAASGVTVNLSLATAQDTLGAGVDTLTGIENLTGSSHNDTLTGTSGNNTLDGGDGDDLLFAGSGKDVLIGGAGADQLSGGGGADVFVFKALTDSAPGAGDTITDFSHGQGDKIDLSAIDADIFTDGDQGFTFIGAAAFGSHADELRYAVDAGVAHVYGDVNGDGVADFDLALTGVTQLVAADFYI